VASGFPMLYSRQSPGNRAYTLITSANHRGVGR